MSAHRGKQFGHAHRERCVPQLARTTEAFELFTEGDVLYDAMLSAIRGATQSIRLESYIFADDEIGWEFARALGEQARQGVEVRVQIDAAGAFLQSTQALDRYLRQQGVHLRWFHRWRWRNPFRYNRRNHHKLLVVDETRAFLGGFNIHRESSRRLYGERRWRDTHVAMDGALASQATQLFDTFWSGERRWDYRPDPAAGAVLLANRSFGCHHRLHCWYTERFRQARERIYVTTPYLVPSARWQQALADAAMRGLDVRLLVPRVSDVTVVQWAAQALFARLLHAGVRIDEYLPRVLHAKTAVIDGEWSTIGTSNMDYRSFFTNYEVNLVARDPQLAVALERQFQIDLAEAERVELPRWHRRGWLRQAREHLGWSLRRWL